MKSLLIVQNVFACVISFQFVVEVDGWKLLARMVYNTHIFPYHHLLIFKLIIVSKWLQCLPKQIWEKWAKTHPSLLPSFWCFYFLSNFKRSPKSSKVPSLDYPRLPNQLSLLIIKHLSLMLPFSNKHEYHIFETFLEVRRSFSKSIGSLGKTKKL